MNLARKRREENFVGRAEQLKVFTENFASSEPAWMILAVTGEGGVGKSTLLERYARLAEETPINAHVVLCDDRYYTPVDVMGAVAEQLARVGIQSREFDERYRKYRQALQQIESDPSAPRGMVDAVTRGLTDFTIKSLRRTPGVGVALEYVDEKAVGEALAELAHYALNRWGNKDEVELVRQPEKILTPLFVELLNQAAGKKRLIVMLDVFERTAATLSEWLMALFKFEYGDLELGVSFILSGRDPLEQHWTELAGLMTHIRLEPFTPEETATYLSNRGITDAGLVRQIHEDTGGLPVLVELLAATNPQPGQPLADISRDAVQRFLQWTPEEDKRRAALLAAIPRQFHQDILKVLLGEAGVPLFHWLTAQSYIRSMQERGWFYHDKVRMLMVRYQYHSAPQEAAACHAALADYFAGLQAQTGLEKGEACKSERWRRLELERLYHRLCAAPESAPACLRNAFLPAFFYQWRFADELLRVARQAAYDSRLNGLEDELTRLEALWTAYDQDDYSKVVSILNALERANHLDPSAEWALLCRRGDAYYWLDRHEQALQDFDRAIALDGTMDWAIAARGETYR
ncbi:MAG: AAA family ATPase, partial [Anaerolineales bacterium]|nr:AAA family ATPase [Anaerolineales bacterium]